ncbi:MAG: HEAT repeat domain-containing protein [Deltaproteobacteria bacterium]|nr:HEAT repeat domain-containing protein [Deltaproteobacteria bacterium]
MQIRKLAVLSVLAGLLAGACTRDPNDPMTWARKLNNVRDQQEALNRLANMSVERARPALPSLIALYKETKKPEHLEALVRYKDPSTIPLFVEALDFTEDDFDRAIVAAGALGEFREKAGEAVPALAKAVEHTLPIKSRANGVRLAAIRALAKIGDKRAVPALSQILMTSADEQDFLLNMKAALALAELRDPAAIPALIKGLFMTGRGANIFQECRLALVRIGEPAIAPLIELLNEKNPEVNAMAKKLDFDKYSPGIVPFKAAILLGDLRAAKAVPALAARLKVPAKSGEHKSILIALGFIGTKPAVDVLLNTLKDKKADAPTRAAAEDGIYLSGDKRAVPILMETARSGYVVVDGMKASDLRANAAIDLSRIAGPEHYEEFKALAAKETEVQGKFGEALDRMQVAKECGNKIECYGKALMDPSWTRAEKAAFYIGFSGQPTAGLPLLLSALKPVASLSQDRYPVQQAILQALTRLATKNDKAVIEALEKQIERDENAVRLPGARDLLGETRVTLAVIQNKG